MKAGPSGVTCFECGSHVKPGATYLERRIVRLRGPGTLVLICERCELQRQRDDAKA